LLGHGSRVRYDEIIAHGSPLSPLWREKWLERAANERIPVPLHHVQYVPVACVSGSLAAKCPFSVRVTIACGCGKPK
jgi:hypothetical protein